MRKTFLILALLGLLTTGFGQTINVTKAPTTMGVYDKFEASFSLGSYDNPYDPDVINVYADFTDPNGRTIHVIGFYYEDYGFAKQQDYEVSQYRRDGNGWRIRFTPDKPGQWTYVIHAIDQNGERKSNTLTLNCQVKNAEGFIRVANSKYLRRDTFVNGQRKSRSYFPVGPNVAWYDAADNKYQKPLAFTTTKNTSKALPAKPISCGFGSTATSFCRFMVRNMPGQPMARPRCTLTIH